MLQEAGYDVSCFPVSVIQFQHIFVFCSTWHYHPQSPVRLTAHAPTPVFQVDPFGDLNTELERVLGKIVAEKYNTGARFTMQGDLLGKLWACCS